MEGPQECPADERRRVSSSPWARPPAYGPPTPSSPVRWSAPGPRSRGERPTLPARWSRWRSPIWCGPGRQGRRDTRYPSTAPASSCTPTVTARCCGRAPARSATTPGRRKPPRPSWRVAAPARATAPALRAAARAPDAGDAGRTPSAPTLRRSSCRSPSSRRARRPRRRPRRGGARLRGDPSKKGPGHDVDAWARPGAGRGARRRGLDPARLPRADGRARGGACWRPPPTGRCYAAAASTSTAPRREDYGVAQLERWPTVPARDHAGTGTLRGPPAGRAIGPAPGRPTTSPVRCARAGRSGTRLRRARSNRDRALPPCRVDATVADGSCPPCSPTSLAWAGRVAWWRMSGFAVGVAEHGLVADAQSTSRCGRPRPSLESSATASTSST